MVTAALNLRFGTLFSAAEESQFRSDGLGGEPGDGAQSRAFARSGIAGVELQRSIHHGPLLIEIESVEIAGRQKRGEHLLILCGKHWRRQQVEISSGKGHLRGNRLMLPFGFESERTGPPASALEGDVGGSNFEKVDGRYLGEIARCRNGGCRRGCLWWPSCSA